MNVGQSSEKDASRTFLGKGGKVDSQLKKEGSRWITLFAFELGEIGFLTLTKNSMVEVSHLSRL
jgi:hypothetical protein